MIWTDLIVEKKISDRQIRVVLQKILNVKMSKIQIIKDYDEFPEAKTMFVVCQKVMFEAGFFMMLSIYLFGEIETSTMEIEEFASAFSLLSNSRCLIPTGDVNPNQMYLFDKAKKEIVFIDENKLDDKGQYFIAT